MAARADQTFRLFLLGAGFSKGAGLPLASELLPLAREATRAYCSVDGGYNHLDAAVERYERFLEDTDPTSTFDLEEFGAWLDWEHTLRLRGSDTFSEQGNEPGLQLRWAIGKVLHDAMPDPLPEAYLAFARGLNTSDMVLTLNYDLVLERALEAVGLPYRRFPSRYSEVYESHSVGDPNQPDELVVSKLHGSIDWTYLEAHRAEHLRLRRLVEGPRPPDDPLDRIAVVPREHLDRYYSSRGEWWQAPPLLMAPSSAKPLAGSPLVPLWDGVGLYAYMLGGFTVIGCSLATGDPYVVQLVHHIATDYGGGLPDRQNAWPQRRMRVVDLRTDRAARDDLLNRYRFMRTDVTDFDFEGFDLDGVSALLA